MLSALYTQLPLAAKLYREIDELLVTLSVIVPAPLAAWYVAYVIVGAAVVVDELVDVLVEVLRGAVVPGDSSGSSVVVVVDRGAVVRGTVLRGAVVVALVLVGVGDGAGAGAGVCDAPELPLGASASVGGTVVAIGAEVAGAVDAGTVDASTRPVVATTGAVPGTVGVRPAASATGADDGFGSGVRRRATLRATPTRVTDPMRAAARTLTPRTIRS